VQQRHALGFLFLVLTAVFALIAFAAVRAEQWVVALAAAVLGGWLLTIARGALRRR
jgi:hypothetical protein